MLILFSFDAESDDEGKIFQWLQYPDCSAKINSLLYDRAKGTGSWFFDSNEFSALKTGKKRVLWLEGSGTPSGFDKCFISSYMMQLVVARAQSCASA